jgi:hypothetical protein
MESSSRAQLLVLKALKHPLKPNTIEHIDRFVSHWEPISKHEIVKAVWALNDKNLIKVESGVISLTKAAPESNPIYLIAIVIGNNDYNATFVELLETINRTLVWREFAPKTFVEDLIRSSIRFHYLAFQANLTKEAKELEQTVSYLQKNIRVLFNEEAQKDIETQDHDHGAWYLEVATGEIYDY